MREVLKGRAKDLKGYIRRNPGRFVSGLGLAAAAPLAGYGAYRLAKPLLQRDEE